MDEELKRKITMLIQAAWSDGHFDIRERAFIYNICLRKGLPLDTIGDLIDDADTTAPIPVPPAEKKAEYLSDCIKLVRIDGKVLPKEIDFLRTLGLKLGFHSDRLDQLLSRIQLNDTVSDDDIRRAAQ